MKNFPNIEVSLTIEGKEMDLDKLTKELGLMPKKTRKPTDWPEAIICNTGLSAQLQPRYVWSICQNMDFCKQIEIPVRKIIAQIEGKEKQIIEFCETNALHKSLCIVIHAETMCLPEMVLPADIISYLGKMELEISFDIYTY